MKRVLVLNMRIVSYLSAGLFLIGADCFADDSYLDRMKERYQYKNWAGSTKTNYLKFILPKKEEK